MEYLRGLDEGEEESNEVENEENESILFKEFKSYSFFKAVHRAEIFNSYPFGKFFEKTLINRIKDLGDKVAEVNSYQDAIKFLHDLKLNYMRHYEFYLSIEHY